MTHSYGQLEPQSASNNSAREIRYEHASNLAEVLDQCGVSILISTYQAGKVVAIGTHHGRLELAFHNYDRPMGISVDPSLDRLAVATRDTIWFANNERLTARQLPPSGSVGTCFLTRAAHVSGDIQARQIAWANQDLWVVNTLFSCLCTLDDRHSFRPRWLPNFIDALAAEDRCHLNGVAIEAGRPKYVTALAETNVAEGWRPVKEAAGCLIDVDSNKVIARGFAMPHSPAVHDGQVYLLDSGRGSLVEVDPNGQIIEVGRFPGYTRGLAIHGDLAVVGLSRIRETSTFGGLPISHRTDELKCGIALVRLTTGQLVSQFEFKSGVDEIFDVAIVNYPGRIVLRGPHATQDGHETIWLVPTQGSTEA